jgi:hypothetical protein
MSDIAGTPQGVPPTAPGDPSRVQAAHEAYAFACMKCSHSWEQEYEIEHHVDGAGKSFVTYLSNGQRVPSPLTRPTCANCGGHVVRIMRQGQVSSVFAGPGQQIPAAGPFMAPEMVPVPTAVPVPPRVAVPREEEPSDGQRPSQEHHRHLPSLRHMFHRKQN